MTANDFQENYGSGWIKLYRSIKNHWIFTKNKPLTQFEAWIVILMEVNHSGKKIQLGYDIIECKRGESLNSLETWAKLFHWNKSKVRRFLNLLKKDSMIELKVCQKTTHLSICNYDSYQGERNRSETEVKQKRNASETEVTPNKNYKKEKNYKNNNKIEEKFNFKNALLNLGIEKQIVDDWIKVRKTKKATNTETAFNRIENQIKISGLTANECIKIAVEKDWKGFNAEWLKNLNRTQKQTYKINQESQNNPERLSFD